MFLFYPRCCWDDGCDCLRDAYQWFSLLYYFVLSYNSVAGKYQQYHYITVVDIITPNSNGYSLKMCLI